MANKWLVIILLVFFCTSLSAQDKKDEEEIITKKIVVTAKRLPDAGQENSTVPANATIITDKDIARSSARTLQDLLAKYAGVIFFDNVGNGVQTTVGLRGFSNGSGLAVYVDGIRMNEPDDNSANLEFIDLSIIQRIEIIPGGSSASRGSGALAGSINIITKDGAGPGRTTAELSYGSFNTVDASASMSGSAGKQNFFISGNYRNSDGFRDNGDIDSQKFFSKYSYSEPDKYRIQVSARYFDGEMGNPGALLPQELEVDREQNPYNTLDFTNSHEFTLAGRYDQVFSEEFSLSTMASYRISEIDVLTTGRSAAIFGGFFSSTENTSFGITSQLEYRSDDEALEPQVILGVEFIQDDFTNIAHYTSALGEPQFKANDRDTSQDTLAVFADASLSINEYLTISGGARYDTIEMSFTDAFNTLEDETDFSNTSGFVGATATLSESVSAYIRYSRSFKTPTVNDLFAFPLFGSNPELEPVTGETIEGGIKLFLDDSISLQAAVYNMELENEIVFVITDPVYFLGQNQNVGESRRYGAEAQLVASPFENILLRVGYSYTKAKNLSQAEESGVDELLIPLVPEHKFTATAQFTHEELDFSWTAIFVGEQVMSSDNLNSGELLDSYFINNAVLGWNAESWGMRLEVRNVFDSLFSTRGIYSFGTTYLTPAPGINSYAGLWVRF